MAAKKQNRCYPPMAIKALEQANGDRQKAYSEYIRLHFQATGYIAPGCDAKELYAVLDEVTLEVMAAAKRCVQKVWKEDGLVRDGTPMVAIPETLFHRLVDALDGKLQR